MFSTAANARCALVRIGHVGVEQRQVELHVQRFLVELARQVHARLGRVDVLVEVEHEVVRDDRVAGREERDEPLDRWRSAGVILRRRSPTSVEKSTSSTVHVFLIAPRYISKNAGYAIGRSVRQKPGIEQARRVGSTCAHWQASQLSGFSSEQATRRRGGRSASAAGVSTVAFAMRVAGRERR